nr:MAG TPA: hypothetical protein [Caudoviricetes sp.]
MLVLRKVLIPKYSSLYQRVPPVLGGSNTHCEFFSPR